MSSVWDALVTAAGLFWRALWALALGYAISSVIQVFVSRRQAARHLGGGSPRQLGLAMLLGFAASSCSFAALSATRSLLAKGAAVTSALAFMFASTNLAIEVAALAFIFLGWQYAVGLFIGAPILVAIMAVIVRLTLPDQWVDDALEQARNVEGHDMDRTEELPKSLRERIRDRRAWERVGSAYVGEWRMVWKELLIGFTVAGAIAALVPDSVFEAMFPRGDSAWLVPLQALLAPVLAVLTFIGSMGNGPLAAILAENGVVFGALMAFLYADFVVPPALKINANYYGWRFAGYLGLVFSVAAVVSGVIMHGLFGLAGAVPSGARNLDELTAFRVDYTLFLNIGALAVAAVLVVAARRSDAADGGSREDAGTGTGSR